MSKMPYSKDFLLSHTEATLCRVIRQQASMNITRHTFEKTYLGFCFKLDTKSGRSHMLLFFPPKRADQKTHARSKVMPHVLLMTNIIVPVATAERGTRLLK